MRRWTIAIVVVLVVLVSACSGDDAAMSPTTTAATTTAATAAPTTAVSERLAHWQDVVKSMSCPELADLEQKRLAVQFNDQTESLIAIHDRQAKLSCPQ
jgi:hypothetical protein